MGPGVRLVGILPAGDAGPGRRPEVLDGHALAGAAGAGHGSAVARPELQGPRQVQEPLRARPVVHHRLRGRGPVHQATPLRDRVGVEPRASRGLHARGAVPRVPRRPAQARVAGGARGRQEHLRGLCPGDRRRCRLPRSRRLHQPRAADRRAGHQGDRRPAGVPARRRSRLPLARPPGRHPLRRRGPAHPARHADRIRPGRRALRARRTVDRVAPARQPPPHRDVDAPSRPRQHPHRRRTRRRHHRHRRLGRRHRARRGRARWPGGAQRLREGPARTPRLAHGHVPLGVGARFRHPRFAGGTTAGRSR